MTENRHEWALSVSDLTTFVSGAVLVVDGEGRLRRADEEATALFGLESGRSGRPSMPPFYDADGDRLPPGKRPTDRAVETGTPVENVECVVETADGRRRVSVPPPASGAASTTTRRGAVLTVDPVTGTDQDGTDGPH
ncbi:hypothetical protein DJ68_00855, partial [Halorubrum sp. C3]